MAIIPLGSGPLPIGKKGLNSVYKGCKIYMDLKFFVEEVMEIQGIR